MYFVIENNPDVRFFAILQFLSSVSSTFKKYQTQICWRNHVRIFYWIDNYKSTSDSQQLQIPNYVRFRLFQKRHAVIIENRSQSCHPKRWSYISLKINFVFRTIWQLRSFQWNSSIIEMFRKFIVNGILFRLWRSFIYKMYKMQYRKERKIW